MAEYDIAAPTRCCASTGRTLEPGEKFYGVLSETEGRFVRTDYAADAWSGPPEGCIAFWAGRIPSRDRPAKPTFNDEHLIGLLTQLGGAEDGPRVNLRYAIALLLMRRKRLKFVDLRRTPAGDLLLLRDSKGGTRHEVLDPRLSEAEIASVQDEVFRQLGWD